MNAGLLFLVLRLLGQIEATKNVASIVDDEDDPGADILKFMQRFEANLEKPVDLMNDLICNCSHFGCDAEIKRFLGQNFTKICRSTSGHCHKRLLPDQSVILSCLSEHPLPELYCATRQPIRDGSVMQCCSNRSFCNGALDLRLPGKEVQNHGGVHIYAMLIIGLISCSILLALSLLFVPVWFNKSMKEWFHRILRRSTSNETLETTSERLLLNSPVEAFGHLGDLLRNLDDSNTTGSGSGLPLLVQRTIARQIELQTEIGKGRFGEVWLGNWRGEAVAVKIFSSRDERSWNREVEIYQTMLLRHPNVLRFIASDNKDTGTVTQLWLITEYHDCGSLFDYLSKNTVSTPEVLKMVRSMSNGLAFLHNEISGIRSKPAIAHRDLKSKNILMRSDLTCVIADLGLAVRYMNGEINLPDNNKCGTVRYLAPEILSDTFNVTHFEAYKTADMYTMGLLIWEIAWRCNVNGFVNEFEQPYSDCVSRDPSVEEMQLCVCVNKRRPTIPKYWQINEVMNEVSRIMQECWANSPSNRLTAMNVRIAVDRLATSHGYKINV